MDITLLFFDGCPNWRIADARLAAIAEDIPGVRVTRHRVESVEEAGRLAFRGSPSFVVDGLDIFAEPHAGVGFGLTCRLYQTPDGPAGVPSVEQIRAALGPGHATP
jgi:hypothetical protein